MGEASAKPQIVDLDWNTMKHLCSQSILQKIEIAVQTEETMWLVQF